MCNLFFVVFESIAQMKNHERNGKPNLNRKLRFHPFYKVLVENEVLRQSLINCFSYLFLQVKLRLPIGCS